ncbi:stimulator of interferon genes protein isoform X2 [Pseudopipra pipra]|uniref:stimulator of interferon genes protein isoform X2 n=1 Tax=Pseudopipra pipra TaxID=415032 RepID=UPI0031387112
MSREWRRPSHPRAPQIPRARGGRAQRAVYLLLALCAAALCLAGEPLVPAARSLTFHFATLQIGALLKGACYLAEEIFHLQSRHHGSFWRALSTCFPPRWHGSMLLLCASAYVALPGDGQPLGLQLGLASLCQLLILALGLQKPSAVEVSEMSERSKQNVAHGLAWSYYVGYLKIVLPRVKKSMEEFSSANPNLLVCRKTWKLHILIPLSCDVYDDLEKADSNIQYLTDLSETTMARAGTKKRVYKHSLYAIRDEENQPPSSCASIFPVFILFSALLLSIRMLRLRITESWIILSWKGPTRIIQSNSWPCTGHPNNPTMCLRVFSKCSLSSSILGAVPTALGSLFSAQPPSGERTFS